MRLHLLLYTCRCLSLSVFVALWLCADICRWVIYLSPCACLAQSLCRCLTVVIHLSLPVSLSVFVTLWLCVDLCRWAIYLSLCACLAQSLCRCLSRAGCPFVHHSLTLLPIDLCLSQSLVCCCLVVFGLVPL